MEFFNLKPRYDVEDLVLIGNHLFCLGVPYDCVPDFRKYVVAGAIAHHLNLRSIDTALKNYMREKEWKSNPSIDPRLRLITQATALVKKEVVSATDKAIATPTNSEKGIYCRHRGVSKASCDFSCDGVLATYGLLFGSGRSLQNDIGAVGVDLQRL